MNIKKQAEAGRPYIPEYGIPADTKNLLPWSHVEQRMSGSLHYWVSTVSPQNRPHSTPLWGVWLEGCLYFDGSPRTRRGRNLAANPAVSVTLEDGRDVVILEGEAFQIIDPPFELAEKLAGAYTDKYRELGYAPEPDTWKTGGLYRLKVRLAFAWTDFPKDTTRWVFAEEEGE